MHQCVRPKDFTDLGVGQPITVLTFKDRTDQPDSTLSQRGTCVGDEGGTGGQGDGCCSQISFLYPLGILHLTTRGHGVKRVAVKVR